MVRRTVCQMLLDREYLLPSDSCADEHITLDQVRPLDIDLVLQGLDRA